MIKNLIFDFGDVFINLDKKKYNSALQELEGGNLPEDMLLNCMNYEMGKISTADFVNSFVDRYYHKLSGDTKTEKEQCFKDKWNSILLDFPLHRLTFLKELANSNKYRLFLLSNTNELHINWIKNDWGEILYEDFKSCFEQFYLSHEINLRKPNKDIYNFVLNENNLIAEESFFIDDTKENTDTAKELGLQVWNINPAKEDVANLFTKNIFH